MARTRATGLLALVLGAALAGCASDPADPVTGADDGTAAPSADAQGGRTDGTEQPAAGEMVLTSPDVDQDGRLPVWATGSYRSFCDGENRSPTLAWSGAPAGTEGFALVLLDVASSGFVHWVVSGIPGDATGLEQAPEGEVSLGTVGSSLAGPGSYLGPCAVDREYRYVLYALDEHWEGSAGTTVSTLQAQVEGSVLATAELVVAPSPDGA